MRKKIISLIVATVMLFSVIPSAYAYPGDDAFLDLGNVVTEEKEADVLCKLLTALGLLSYETSNFIQTELADYSDIVRIPCSSVKGDGIEAVKAEIEKALS